MRDRQQYTHIFSTGLISHMIIKEHVRDLGITLSSDRNYLTYPMCGLESTKSSWMDTAQDKRKETFDDTVLVTRYTSARVLLSVVESMAGKRETGTQSSTTIIHKKNVWRPTHRLLRKAK